MTAGPLEWYDSFLDTPERKIFTHDEHGIPGLRSFGYHNTNHAIKSLKEHYHKNSFEFTFLKRGNLKFSIGDKNYDLTGGDFFFTFPNEVHGSAHQALSIHEMYWFQIDISDPNNFLYLSPEIAQKIINELENMRQREIKINNHTAKIFPLIFDNINSNKSINKIYTSSLLCQLLCYFIENSQLCENQVTSDIQSSIDYINSHIKEKIEIEELAQVSFLSVSHFKQKFKSQMGTGPRNYISFHKIEIAKEMLEKGYSITRTAIELNFSNSDYFSTVFKRYTFMSPSQYVKNIKDKGIP